MNVFKHKKQVQRFIVYSTIVLVFIVGGIFLALRGANEQASTASRPQKTSTPTQLLTATGTVQPLFWDDFVDNSKGWSVVNETGYTRTFQDGALILSSTTHNVLVESLPTRTVFTNFALTMTFTLAQGDQNDSVGLYLRGDSNLDHDYRIDIFGNNTYAISKEALAANNMLEQTYLVRPSPTPLLKPEGQKNKLVVSMQGSTMTVQINGVPLHSLTETSYTRGQIALFVANGQTSNGVTAKIHDLVIYPLPENPDASTT